MPKLGDIKSGYALGFKDKNIYRDFIWTQCPRCKEERWVRSVNWKPRSYACRHCAPKLRQNPAGSESPQWKGGRFHTNGYIIVRLFPNNFFYPMVNSQKYVAEHRLVMAKHLGRCLHTWELVHHINGIKDDNRLENLQLVSDDKHSQLTIIENKVRVLERRVLLLEAENARLNAQLREVIVRLE